MNIRTTQASLFGEVDGHLTRNQLLLLRAQRQVVTGKRIQKPSDDPVGAARVLAYARRAAGVERFTVAAQSGVQRLDAAAGRLQEASTALGEARDLLVQGLNGTLNEGDRKVLATQVRQLRAQLIEVANAQSVEGFLFAGTDSGSPPFVESTVNGRARVSYAGNGVAPQVLVGDGLRVATGLPGDGIFASVRRSGTSIGGFTGVASGQSGDVGSGSAYLQLRHDATVATLGAGLALANGGADDTLLGAHTLVVDAVAGTVQLDGGKALDLPQPGDPDVADFVVTNEHGAELHLDFSGYTGAGFSGTVQGDGSISLDGATWTQLDFVDDDLAVSDPATGTTVHVDTTGIHRAGSELVVFGGAVNVFDVLQGIADDLENVDGLPDGAVLDRLSTWLSELDRNHDQVVSGLSELGGLSRHLTDVGARLADEGLGLAERRSDVEDADLSQAVLDMTRAEQTLQLAQATGARLLSTSLLDFLR